MLICYYYLSPIHNIFPCCYITNIHILTTTVDMLLLLKSSEVLFFLIWTYYYYESYYVDVLQMLIYYKC